MEVTISSIHQRQRFQPKCLGGCISSKLRTGGAIGLVSRDAVTRSPIARTVTTLRTRDSQIYRAFAHSVLSPKSDELSCCIFIQYSRWLTITQCAKWFIVINTTTLPLVPSAARSLCHKTWQCVSNNAAMIHLSFSVAS